MNGYDQHSARHMARQAGRKPPGGWRPARFRETLPPGAFAEAGDGKSKAVFVRPGLVLSIGTEKKARSALTRIRRDGKDSEISKVEKAVFKAYPDLKKSGGKDD